MCIRFHYLYRDSGNYKRYGYKDFSVSDIPDLFLELEFIQSKLIDGKYFDHSLFQVPELYFDSYNHEFDHDWHEFTHLEWLKDGIGGRDWEDWKDCLGGKRKLNLSR